MGDRRGNGNFSLAFENVERGRTELTFAADDFSLAKPAFDDGAAIQLQKSSGNAFEDGNLQQVFRFKPLGARTDSDRCSDDAFVG